ncbi:MAG TPA: ABC transporter permease [Cytophagaceae bacterium]|nr:ABC transporter permease [Cytophagaceae bacterium]
MKQFLVFVKKEFLHVFRDRKTLLMLFGLPIAQIILFGFALSNEIKNSEIAVIDYAGDIASKQIIDKIEASKYFEIKEIFSSHQEIEAAFKKGKIKLVVVFPANFYNDLLHLNKAQVQVIADASDANTATALTNYITSIITDCQSQISQKAGLTYSIIPEMKMLYNPELKSAPNFVPGVMAMILQLVCVMMTSISIVKEKELGTMEVLLVSPFKPIFIIFSKMVPYLIVSLFNVTSIIVLSRYLLEVPIKGNIFLLLVESFLFIITALSLGLLISTITKSQQGAMFTSMLTMMLPTLLLSGYMFPIENMPIILQVISYIVPSKWYYIIIKDIMLKGLGFSVVWKETLILAVMAVVLLGISLKSFKIRLE